MLGSLPVTRTNIAGEERLLLRGSCAHHHQLSGRAVYLGRALGDQRNVYYHHQLSGPEGRFTPACSSTLC